jgi:hypothetical protein
MKPLTQQIFRIKCLIMKCRERGKFSCAKRLAKKLIDLK